MVLAARQQNTNSTPAIEAGVSLSARGLSFAEGGKPEDMWQASIRPESLTPVVLGLHYQGQKVTGHRSSKGKGGSSL